HEGRQLKAIPLKDIKEAYDLITPDHDVLAIDEAQFFSNDIVGVATYFANRGLRVIVAGLEMDYRGAPFGPMPELLAVADHITKLHAVCVKCGTPALFSHRKSKEEGVVVIGSLDKYEPLCRNCFLKATSDD
ncbi:MAG: thymidine kinase, partial [Chlorobi bacterium]|nr:thymidine kinase [Chlorobiota bacterium]